MTARERILVLRASSIEEHAVAAILGLTEAEVSKTLSDPEYVPAETDVDPAAGLSKAEVEALILVENERAVTAEGALDVRLKAAIPPL